MIVISLLIGAILLCSTQNDLVCSPLVGPARGFAVEEKPPARGELPSFRGFLGSNR